MRRQIMKPLLSFLVFLSLLLLTTGCDLTGGALQNGVNEVTKTNAILDTAINALANQSADWQSIVQDTQAKLTDAAQSTVRTEVSNTLQRAEQAAGSQVKCIIDFLRVRVREDLIRIRAELLKQPVDPPVPVVCSVVPAALDLNLDPTRRNLITLDGYNFDTVPPIQTFLVNGTQLIDETTNLHLTSHYQVTLNTGSNGIQVSSTSQKIVLQWKGQPISDIPVIASTPRCETRTEKLTPPPITFIAPHTHGDADFYGHGPRVFMNVYPSYSFAKANILVEVSFIETGQPVDTVAEGDQTYTLYTPVPGWKIQYVSDSVTTHWEYTHSSSNPIDVVYPGMGYVTQLRFSGFEGGNAAGSTAQVTIIFKELTVQLIQTTNCQ